MKIPYQYPDPSGTERSEEVRRFRQLANEVSRLRPQAQTKNNGEETDHAPEYPTSFTKGLHHNNYGVLSDEEDYRCFVGAINSKDRTLFDKQVNSAVERGLIIDPDFAFNCVRKIADQDGNIKFKWRGWESPRAGHVYELQGPDAGSVGMAPAPRVGSSEMAAEMAEIYALAILRDVPFDVIAEGGSDKLSEEGGNSELSANEIAQALNTTAYYSKNVNELKSSTFNLQNGGLNLYESRRIKARTPAGVGLSAANLFRGSTVGAHDGPYISQFMYVGNSQAGGQQGGNSSFPQLKSNFDPEDGFIVYGTQIIDQRCVIHKSCLDYMTTWSEWLDIQNGADHKGLDSYEKKRRFITTPRDLATYVHFDALYQAYLNACLILLGNGTPASKGFPEPTTKGHRTAFATFGGPHILSLVTEVATRCLKAVRRQKFNYHRRPRPEAMGGMMSLVSAKDLLDESLENILGCSYKAFEEMHADIPEVIRTAIKDHNAKQNTAQMAEMRKSECPDQAFPPGLDEASFSDHNLLLPMAFPEGSPMHPAYGAGHATVAGGCVTMLKAFFDMWDHERPDNLRLLDLGEGGHFSPNADGTKLEKHDKALTIQGELDKLAANIAIGRNMAGVHYYTDYYDSLRMGERIAIGILLEQAPTYGDEMETSFNSFDGDLITIYGEAGTSPSLSIMDAEGNPVPTKDWWLRHVPGEEMILDM